jgi:hypothetical protein
MENAISCFFANSEENHVNACAWLTRLFSTSNVDAEWHVKNFCRQLLATNPLRINSTQHGPFWDMFNTCTSKAINSYDEEISHSEGRDYVVFLNDGEIVQKLKYVDALVAIIFTLRSNALTRTIISVYNIPEHIMLAMLKRKEPRRMFFERFASKCEDQVDIYVFYNRGLITNDVLHDTLEEYTDENGQHCFVTPPPEENESMEVDSEIIPTKVLKQNLPARPRRVELHCPNKMGIQYTLAFYTYLWSEVSKTVESVQYQCKQLHGVECKCQMKLLNMRVLLPLLSAYVEQSLDLRTLVRPDVRTFFAISEPLHDVFELVSKHISQYLSGAPACPQLDMFIHNHTIQANDMEQNAKRLWDGSARSVFTCRIAELPLEMLLRELDSEYLFATALPKLRGFLAKQDRDNYIAYQMPQEVGLFDVSATLGIVCEKFGSTFPALRNICPVWAKSGVYVVCKPGVMNILRCLMLSERIVEATGRSSGRRNYCLELPQSSLVLRNCLMHANSFSQENASAANLSLAILLDHYMGGRRTIGSPIFIDGHPNNSAILNLYKYIPWVCHILECKCETEAEWVACLSAFLNQTLRHVCEISVLRHCLLKLQNRIPDESPHRRVVDKLTKAYRLKRASKSSSGEDIGMSRRKDPDINHTSFYTLLLTTGVFDSSEIVEYLRAFRLEFPSQSLLGKSGKPAVKYPKLYVENTEKFDKRSHDAICEYWERQSFVDNAMQHYQQLEAQMCPVQLSNVPPLEHRVFESHYEVSRFGHTFKRVQSEDEVCMQHSVEEIRSVCALLSRLEAQHHGKDSSYTEYNIFDIIYADKPLCMPLSLSPDIYFENSFFVYIGAEWPLPYNPSVDILTNSGDLPLSTKRNLLDYAAENCGGWKVSSRLTSGANTRYTDCVVAIQNAHKISVS